MTTHFEYSVKLTDFQKSKLAKAIKKRYPLTLRLKHSNLDGNDDLLLTKRQVIKIEKSIVNGTNINLSHAQIRKMVQHGGNLITSLESLGAKVLPYSVKGIPKAVPALATGAVSALGSLGIDKISRRGISIPKKYFPMLPPFKQEFTKAQINQINKAYQTGGRLVIKPTRKQIEGGFLGTLASIGIPMAISLVPKMFGSGLQVDRRASTNTRNVYVPPVKTRLEGRYPYFPPPFCGSWGNPVGAGVKKKFLKKGKRTVTRKRQPLTSNSNFALNFVNKPLTLTSLIGYKNLR